jgi:hypothetical protein
MPPKARLTCGVVAGAALVFVANMWIHNRTGHLIAAFGAGVAGVGFLMLVVLLVTGRERF